MAIKISEVFHVFFRQRSKKVLGYNIFIYFSYDFWLAMFPIPIIPETKKTTSTVNNIVFDQSLKRFCMRDVCNLK